MRNNDVVSEESLENQYQKWLSFANPSNIIAPDDDVLKETIERDLIYFSNMSVTEYTLYQKWEEVQAKYPTKMVSTIFCEDEVVMSDYDKWLRTENVMKNIWVAESPEDYLNLEPRITAMSNRIFTP